MVGPVRVSQAQVLAWRLRRQYLEPTTTTDVVAVAGRLCGVQAQVPSAATLAVGVRRDRPADDEVSRALVADRTLVRMWAARGTLHLLPGADAPTYCAALAALRFWERGSWARGHGITAEDIAAILEATASVLPDRVLTREELVAAILGHRSTPGLVAALESGWGAVLKPAAYLGLLCHGPPQGNRVTFTSPRTWLPQWREPDVDDAGAALVRAYLGAHGPGDHDTFAQWLFRNQRPALTKRWWACVEQELVAVDVDGAPAWVLAEHADELAGCVRSRVVRLLPAFDQYVVAASRTLIPTAHRRAVSRTSGWISPVVLSGGRLTGVWRLNGTELAVDLFERVPRKALAAEAARVGAIAGVEPQLTVGA